jgi:hypothetical protein
VLAIEPGTVTAEGRQQLETMGYLLVVTPAQGSAHSIRVDARTGVRTGVADRRDPDAGAAGY